MRTSIITMNSAYNYGAQLQAYALLKTVESLGSECNIIDRRFVIIILSTMAFSYAVILLSKKIKILKAVY